MRTDMVIKASLESLARAQIEYDRWVGESWWRLPEYVASVCVARAITKSDATYVTIESNVKNAILIAQGDLRGRHGRLSRLDGRFDIVVWNKTEPRGVIEIKSSPCQHGPIVKDVKRICSTLNRTSNIRWGLIAYTIVIPNGKRKTAKVRLTQRTESIECTVSECLTDEFKLQRYSTPLCDYVHQGARKAEILKISRA